MECYVVRLRIPSPKKIAVTMIMENRLMYQFGRLVSLIAISLSLLLLSPNPKCFAEETVQQSQFGQMLSNLNPANWKMPKMPNFRNLMPKKQETEMIMKKKDGLVDEVGKTASSSWSRTKSAFNPQKLNPANFLPASAMSPSKPVAEAKKPGFFQSLFAPANPKEDTITTNGFLSQPRPKP